MKGRKKKERKKEGKKDWKSPWKRFINPTRKTHRRHEVHGRSMESLEFLWIFPQLCNWIFQSITGLYPTVACSTWIVSIEVLPNIFILMTLQNSFVLHITRRDLFQLIDVDLMTSGSTLLLFSLIMT
jgi:hypothetical protein